MHWLKPSTSYSSPPHARLDRGRRRQFIANLCVAGDEPSEPKAVQRALDQMDTKASGIARRISR